MVPPAGGYSGARGLAGAPGPARREAERGVSALDVPPKGLFFDAETPPPSEHKVLTITALLFLQTHEVKTTNTLYRD